jgi:hypothetical protein
MPALVFRLQPITGLTYRNPQGDNFGLYKQDRSFLVREISLAIIIVDNGKALHNSYFLKEDGLFFSSLRGVDPIGRRPRLSGWSFQQRIYGGVLPPPHCPDKSGPAVSPTDTLRKDSALRLGRARRGPPVTSEKSTLFIGVTKIVRFCKALNVSTCM